MKISDYIQDLFLIYEKSYKDGNQPFINLFKPLKNFILIAKFN